MLRFPIADLVNNGAPLKNINDWWLIEEPHGLCPRPSIESIKSIKFIVDKFDAP
jgi:hypothetical protein